MRKLDIVICGGGNGACACAALQLKKGHQVSLFTAVPGEAEQIRTRLTKNGGLDATVRGERLEGLQVNVTDDPAVVHELVGVQDDFDQGGFSVTVAADEGAVLPVFQGEGNIIIQLHIGEAKRKIFNFDHGGSPLLKCHFRRTFPLWGRGTACGGRGVHFNPRSAPFSFIIPVICYKFKHRRKDIPSGYCFQKSPSPHGHSSGADPPRAAAPSSLPE